MKPRIKIPLIAAVIAIVIVAIMLLSNIFLPVQSVFNGTQVCNPDSLFHLDFTVMNQELVQTLQPKAGDTLAVSYHIGSGSFSAKIACGEETLWRGDRITEGSFNLPFSGTEPVIVSVTASGAKNGQFDISIIKPTAEE